MEPDFDSILSRKIRQAEQRPVSWNKQDVWEKLQSRTGRRRRYRYYYYAAAAMILLLIYFAVGTIPQGSSPRVTETNEAPGANPALSTTPRLPVEKQDPVPERIADGPDITVAAVREDPSGVTDTTRPAPLEIALVEVLPDRTDHIQIPAEDVLLTEAVAVPEQKIRPVVGIITESYPEEIATVKRKKGLRKLKSTDPAPWEDTRQALVFAVRR